MAKYFKKVKSYSDLKSQFKTLLKANHPDNGGDAEVMKEINAEYDALFAIWKDKEEKETGEKVTETAEGTRFEFYTDYGWAGSNYNGNLSLKEIAKIVRTYIKEKYPLYKFSVRTSYSSMCQELHVDILESPIEIYKPFDELTSDDFSKISKCLYPWDYVIDERLKFLNASKEEKRKVIEESESSGKNVLNDITKAVIDDVDAFVNSYNYNDCDGMIDYFDVNFYYFGCCQEHGKYVKIVPKTPRIKNQKKEVKPKASEKPKKEEKTEQVEEKAKEAKYTYKITRGEDTRDGSVLWLVRVSESLSKEQYIAESEKMKSHGGYYSKFKHAFIFRTDPTEILGGKTA